MTRIGILGAPRKTPSRVGPIVASGMVIVFALPLFLIAGWPLGGWGVAAVLWLGTQAIDLLLARLKPSPDNLAASGVLAFGMMFKVLAVMIVLIALASSDAGLVLAAVIVYGLAYSVELGLSLATYYGQEPTA